MSDLRCPRCGDSFRIPSVDLPSGPPASELNARCPWCAEIIPLTQLLTALPPVAQLIGDDGQPLAVAASGGEGENPFGLQPAGLPVAASAVDAGAFTEEGFAGEEAFGGAEDFTGDSFDFAAADASDRDADGDSYLGDDRYVGDDQDDSGQRYEEFSGGGSGFAEVSMEADEFEESEHAGPVEPRPIEEVSGASFSPEGHLVTPRARAQKKSSSLRSILGVVVGGLLALPLAAGILALLGKPLDLGFWPFDGQTIATGGAARTAAPVLPLSDEARPARAPQPGRSLAEDMPRGELMTMDPAEESGLASDEQPAVTGPGNPWEFPQSPGRASMTGPEMVTPQVAEEVEPEAAVADAPAFDPFAAEPFAAEPFAADSRGGDVAVPGVADPGVADPGTAAPGDIAANMNNDPFAPLEQPFAPLDSEPAETDPPASPANDFSLDDPLLTLPAEPAPAEPAGAAPVDAGEAPDAPEMSQQAVAPGAVAPEADAEPPTTETATTQTPAPLAPAEEAPTAQPNAEEDIAVTPAEPAPTADAAPENVSPNASAAEGVGQSVASAAGQPAEAAAPERPATERSASSPQFAAAQAAAESALQAIRDYDLAAGVAGLRPHLAKLYEHVAALGELAEPQDAPALAALTEQILEINVVKDLAPAAPNWAKYSRRPNDGMLAVGPLRREADTWLLDWGGPTPLEIRFGQGDAEAQPQAKVLVLGRILSSDPAAPAMEATFLQSLD